MKYYLEVFENQEQVLQRLQELSREGKTIVRPDNYALTKAKTKAIIPVTPFNLSKRIRGMTFEKATGYCFIKPEQEQEIKSRSKEAELL